MVAERRIEGWVASHPLVSMPSLLVTHTGASVLQDDAHHRIGVEILSESLRWSRKESCHGARARALAASWSLAKCDCNHHVFFAFYEVRTSKCFSYQARNNIYCCGRSTRVRGHSVGLFCELEATPKSLLWDVDTHTCGCLLPNLIQDAHIDHLVLQI